MTNIAYCARADCHNKLKEKRRVNQKYCSAECCRIATNERLMHKYYANKRRNSGKPRMCEECGTNKLSKYNEDEICNQCQNKHKTSTNAMLNMLFDGVEFLEDS